VRAIFVNEDYSGKQYTEFTKLLEQIIKIWIDLEGQSSANNGISWNAAVEGLQIRFPIGYSKQFHDRVEELLKKNRIEKFDDSEPFEWEWRKKGGTEVSQSLVIKPY
jgi:hypothetical protein